VISVKTGDQKSPTYTAVLSLCLPKVPDYITAGYLHIPVCAYIPNL